MNGLSQFQRVCASPNFSMQFLFFFSSTHSFPLGYENKFKPQSVLCQFPVSQIPRKNHPLKIHIFTKFVFVNSFFEKNYKCYFFKDFGVGAVAVGETGEREAPRERSAWGWSGWESASEWCGRLGLWGADGWEPEGWVPRRVVAPKGGGPEGWTSTHGHKSTRRP